MVRVEGATAIAVNVALVTVSFTVCEIDPIVAEIVVDPGLAPVAWPTADTVATLVSDEAHVTCPAMGRCPPSL